MWSRWATVCFYPLPFRKNSKMWEIQQWADERNTWKAGDCTLTWIVVQMIPSLTSILVKSVANQTPPSKKNKSQSLALQFSHGVASWVGGYAGTPKIWVVCYLLSRRSNHFRFITIVLRRLFEKFEGNIRKSPSKNQFVSKTGLCSTLCLKRFI